MRAEVQERTDSAQARQEQRFAVQLPAQLRSGALAVPVEIRDLSRGGCLAEAAFPPLCDNLVMLAREKLIVEARVVWTKGRRFGLRFEAPLSAIDLFVQLSHNRALAEEPMPAAPPRARRASA